MILWSIIVSASLCFGGWMKIFGFIKNFVSLNFFIYAGGDSFID